MPKLRACRAVEDKSGDGVPRQEGHRAVAFHIGGRNREDWHRFMISMSAQPSAVQLWRLSCFRSDPDAQRDPGGTDRQLSKREFRTRVRFPSGIRPLVAAALSFNIHGMVFVAKGGLQ
jgi:hypothetical protein